MNCEYPNASKTLPVNNVNNNMRRFSYQLCSPSTRILKRNTAHGKFTFTCNTADTKSASNKTLDEKPLLFAVFDSSGRVTL